MKIVIVCRYPFPIGYSGTNRILSYSRGLVELGCQVCVVVACRTESQKHPTNVLTKGIYGAGIEYEYVSATTVMPSSRWAIRASLALDLCRSLKRIVTMSREKPIDALLISSDFAYDVYLFSVLGKCCTVKKVFWIVDELPIGMRYRGKSVSALSKALYRSALCRMNGQIAMTQKVRDVYREVCSSEHPTLIMPMTVEADRFSLMSEADSKLIAYAGNMEIKKDGLNVLIEAFRLFCERRKDYRLLLIGDGRDSSQVKSMVKGMGLAENVMFAGSAHRDEIPRLLGRASMLCLPRENSLRAAAGFPTKLGEYLATGKPVIVTGVGEIEAYLTDNVNAYIVEPDSVVSLLDRMMWVADHYEEARKVGLEGRKLAEGVFDYKKQAVRLCDFMKRV